MRPLQGSSRVKRAGVRRARRVHGHFGDVRATGVSPRERQKRRVLLGPGLESGVKDGFEVRAQMGCLVGAEVLLELGLHGIP